MSERAKTTASEKDDGQTVSAEQSTRQTDRKEGTKQAQRKRKGRQREKQREKMDELNSTKKEIGWGSQIRSYVLDASRIKDLRTNVETSNTQAVLDGEIDFFIEACLKWQGSPP